MERKRKTQSLVNGRLLIAAMSATLAAATPSAMGQCGGKWTAFGSGMSSVVNALGEYNGDLIAAGSFGFAGGIPVNNIARWDGESWKSVGGGLNNLVRSVVEVNGELIAGGTFTTAGSTAIARWNGAAWSPLGSLVAQSPPFPPKFSFLEVNAVIAFNGELVAGGRFNLADGLPIRLVARWDGSQWQSIGNLDVTMWSTEGVHALTVHNGELIAGGTFISAENGAVSLNRIARWDGSAWHPFGTGMNGIVSALAVYDGDLIAGGNFTTAGGVTVNRIARWNGAAWEPLDTGMNDMVRALAVYNGELIAGGSFTTAGDVTVNYIARWDGSSWQPFVVDGAIGASSTVSALSNFNGDLVAGGGFTSIGGTSANRIARWSAPLGACCINGVAIQTFAVDCAAAGGEFHGGGVPSADVTCAPTCTADLTGSGTVGVPDLLMFLDNWGPCP